MKTWFIDLFSTIKKTMVSFVSITLFVMLGAGIFLGIDWSTKGFENTIDNTLSEWNMHDISLIFPYGFSDEEINKISQLDYIDKVEGQNSFESSFIYNDYRYQAKVITVTNQIDDPHKLVGRIPSKEGEIAFERHWAEINGVEVGDIIVFEHDDDGTAHNLYNLINEDLDALQENSKTEDGMKYLTTDTFVVTGLFENATYVNQYKTTYGISSTTSIPNDCITYVSEDSIDLKAFNGYQSLLLTSKQLEGLNTFEDDYKQLNEELIDRLKVDIKDYVEKTNSNVLNAINNIREDINSQIEDGENEIVDAERKIIDAEKKIKDGEIQIADGKLKLIEAEAQLSDAKNELDKGWAEYNVGLAQYNEIKASFDEFTKVYDRLTKLIDVYETIKGIPDVIDGYYSNYLIINAELKNILNIASPLATSLIDDFFNKYKAGYYDDRVLEFAQDIKEIINAEDLPVLKDTLLSIEDPNDSVLALIQLIEFVEGVNDDIDSAIELYELCKNDFMAYIIENEVIDFTEEQINKIKDVLDYIKNNIDDVYTEAEKYEMIFNIILSQYDSDIQNLKDVLDTVIAPEIEINRIKLEAIKEALDDGYRKLILGQKEYEEGLLTYENGLVELKENEELLIKSKADLLDGKKKLEEGKDELEIAKNKAKDFDEKVAKVDSYDATALGRNMNAALASTVVPLDIMGSFKYTLALLFVVVGIFICYSALSRNVYDQIIQIGTKKALGMSRKNITASFLLYGSIATIMGGVLGFILARFVIEPIVLYVLSKNYITSSIKHYFSLSSGLYFLLFEFIANNLTTYLACNKILKKRAVKLLQGSEDLIGKSHFYEKLPGWNRLSLLTKTIINNCVNDSRRVIATLVGIAGCCSLMVCGVSIITNMDDSLAYQLNNVTKMDSIVYYDSSIDGAVDNINNTLDNMNLDYNNASYTSLMIENKKGNYCSGVMYIYNDDEFFDFFDVALDGVRQQTDGGICIAKAFAQFNDIEVGDYVVYVDSVGEKHNIRVSAIFDYYLLRGQAVISRDAYISAVGKNPGDNTILIKRGNHTNSEINEALMSIDGYFTTSDYLDDANTVFSSLRNPMWIVVAVFFVSAFILASLVLLNLLIVFVEEKKKELIVMMINGYSRKRVKAYIYGDTIILVIIGVIIGAILGVTVGFATIKTFDSDYVTLMRNINIPSYLLCAALTSMLAGISCLIALRRIDKFKLTDINAK